MWTIGDFFIFMLILFYGYVSMHLCKYFLMLEICNICCGYYIILLMELRLLKEKELADNDVKIKMVHKISEDHRIQCGWIVECACRDELIKKYALYLRNSSNCNNRLDSILLSNVLVYLILVGALPKIKNSMWTVRTENDYEKRVIYTAFRFSKKNRKRFDTLGDYEYVIPIPYLEEQAYKSIIKM